ncbi:hypothetical protein PENANT_c003G09875 [Penicillium antarcticum]|uniref:Uncharacterized protein n=1 Tax=Penicillium antarcticum TaxID=416450 RepID=A0A1V6QIJ9_9EURO|nr:hypothetical protein PENANT_c003G09875 [Penicillium antarcticum]
MACIVRKKDKGDSPGSLYMGIVGSPNEWKLGLKLEWPASDVIQLSFSGENNIYIVFRPQRTDRSHKHKIPVLHACLTTKHMYPLIIEPQGGGNSFKFSAIWIPVSATVAYCLSGVLGTLDIERKDPHLPRLSWLPPDPNRDDNSPSRAAFVVIALASKISGLADTFNTFLFVEVLSEMASVSVLHVWACECLAFIRFYRCIYQHRNYLERENIALVQRWSVKNYSDYPYRGYGQAMLAYLALLGCVFVLLVANGAALWNGFHLLPFLASYLTVIFFIGTWILLKIFRSAPWSFVDLSQPKKVADIFKHLHAIRFGVTDSNEDISER